MVVAAAAATATAAAAIAAFSNYLVGSHDGVLRRVELILELGGRWVRQHETARTSRKKRHVFVQLPLLSLPFPRPPWTLHDGTQPRQ